MLDAIVWICSMFVGSDPFRLHVAMLRLGFDTRRADVREAIMARGCLR